MIRTAWIFSFVVLFWAALGTDRANAQSVIVVAPPRVAYYYAPPVVSYYAPAVAVPVAPPTAYYYAPPVYAAPAVSYYAAPAVSYYAPAAAVTTTRYGLFGQPRASSTYYYPPVYVRP